MDYFEPEQNFTYNLPCYEKKRQEEFDNYLLFTFSILLYVDLYKSNSIKFNLN